MHGGALRSATTMHSFVEAPAASTKSVLTAFVSATYAPACRSGDRLADPGRCRDPDASTTNPMRGGHAAATLVFAKHPVSYGRPVGAALPARLRPPRGQDPSPGRDRGRQHHLRRTLLQLSALRARPRGIDERPSALGDRGLRQRLRLRLLGADPGPLPARQRLRHGAKRQGALHRRGSAPRTGENGSPPTSVRPTTAGAASGTIRIGSSTGITISRTW